MAEGHQIPWKYLDNGVTVATMTGGALDLRGGGRYLLTVRDSLFYSATPGSPQQTQVLVDTISAGTWSASNGALNLSDAVAGTIRGDSVFWGPNVYVRQ